MLERGLNSMDSITQLPGAGPVTMILAFLVVLTIVVFFHELGHFLVARWNGVKIDAFSVGFGPELIGFNDKHGTRWKLAAVPLGGYVKFHGDMNGASMPDVDVINAMSEEEKAVSFAHKKVWQRASIVAAGPIANFILAIVIFTFSLMFFGRIVSDPLVSMVQPGSAAEAAGFQAGDIVKLVDGERIASFTDIPRLVAPNPGRELVFTVERDGKELVLPVTPRLEVRKDRFGNREEVGLIGITNDGKAANARVEKYGPVDAIGRAIYETWFIISRSLSGLWDMITGAISVKQLSGPIGIAKTSGDVATLGVGALVNWVALISVSIGLLNLFPIPILDGGHLVFYAYEAIRGKPLSDNAQEYSFRVGLALLLTLMVVATWNDISTRIFNFG
ncbi:MAG: RIP metalloprotease RseP [Nitratireductor sp.]|nr:RIP metalloprotease RseP [Nitratireductor sp.]MCB1457208.1 RIP metalloprotease RseP [Nitratireductor sp.]